MVRVHVHAASAASSKVFYFSQIMYWLKWVMWACFMRESFMGRFISVFFVDIGLSESHIGVLFGLRTLMLFIATPFWSWIADKTRSRYLVFQISIIGSAITAVFLVLPYYVFNIQHNVSLLFALMIAACITFYLFSGVYFSLQDTLIILAIDNKKKYGTVRKHGAISWGIFHIFVGILLDIAVNIEWTLILYSIMSIPYSFIAYITFKREPHKRLKPQEEPLQINQTQLLRDNSFIQHGNLHLQEDVELTHDTNVTCSVPMKEYQTFTDVEEEEKCKSMSINDEEQKPAENVSKRELLLFVLSNPSTISLYFLMFSVGGGQQIATSLLFPYVLQFGTEKYASWLYSLLGLSVAVTVVFEIPIFHISERVINTLGYKKMIIVGTICLVLRCIGYSLLTADTLWCLVFIEPLHGITYALIQLSTVNIMFELFGEKYAATAQGSISAIRSGLGPLVFVSAAGYVMQYISGEWLYRGTALWITLALIIFVISTKKVNFDGGLKQ